MLSGGDFGQLRAFVAVAEALSFSKAARTLGVSPSALSQTVRALEDRMELRLLQRTTRSVSLTSAGEVLLARVRPAVSDLDGAVDHVQRFRGHPAGVVRVHAFRQAVLPYITPIVASFCDAHPQVVLDITVDDAAVDVVASGYDAAIRVGEFIERDMIAVRLGPDMRQVVVASPAYLARYGRPKTPRDLHAHRCIGWRWPGRTTPYRWEFSQKGRWFEVAVSGPLIVNNRDVAIDAALAGVGLAFVVESYAAEAIAEGRLVKLLERWSAPYPGFYLCYPKQRHMPPALRAFVDAVRASDRKR